MSVDIQGIKDQVLRYSEQLDRVKAEVRKVLIGQDQMLERLLTDDALRDRLVTEASEHVLRFDWDDIAQRTRAIYSELVDSDSEFGEPPRSAEEGPGAEAGPGGEEGSSDELAPREEGARG